MLKHDYRNSTSIRNDVVVCFGNESVEVWADEDGQHGIVAMFRNGGDAARFIWKNYRLDAGGKL